ncbi:SEC-C metal-binding domain-containing protein [Mesorhizobium sp. IMUNJ 23232]|uniref:SEC-C metal-binding domain-containing protein n=1 Tax=Mesorhizobium sp. IMUNJ 23232 TaxID=3376064 RepID=UPI0037983FDF
MRCPSSSSNWTSFSSRSARARDDHEVADLAAGCLALRRSRSLSYRQRSRKPFGAPESQLWRSALPRVASGAIGPRPTGGRLQCARPALSTTSPAFEVTSKRRKSYPSETHVKRGHRFVHDGVELIEKLGRNDPCPCGSGRLFQEMLPEERAV